MRDYLKLSEIESILERYITDDTIYTEIIAAINNEAETCLCAALCSDECCCGAWEASDDVEFHYDDF